jgi:hypothetical protein
LNARLPEVYENARHARRLGAQDAAAIAEVFHSQDKLMLREKDQRQRGLAERLPRMLEKDCEGYGTFDGEALQAFCVFFPWRDLPFSTLVLIQGRPTPGPVDFSRNGLAACLDAAFASLEARGYTHTVFRRTLDPKWRTGFLLQKSGRLGEYAYTVSEKIAAGGVSRWERVNRCVLDNQPVELDTAIVVGARPAA